MTFSIVGRSPDGTALGVAVASKFLAVGGFVPALEVGVGALATQAAVNLALKAEGLALMRGGASAAEALDRFLAADEGRAERQAGAVDADGRAATRTGSACHPWAGGEADEGPEGSFAAQGNILVGPEVIEAMVAAWRASAAERSLPRRLLAALEAGDAAGGDRRGRQSAALVVVAPGGGYGGSDVVVDLRSDDDAAPVAHLARMLGEHELLFGRTPPEELLAWDDGLRAEVRRLLDATGTAGGDLDGDLERWAGAQNLEERVRPGGVDRLDPVLLAQLRRADG
ncbi:DUF1028 domain-containing protein [uncultured Pseudokineococcus sp.]|uniref:DUF1028 domain-containing protein n=1 Tax=uncultured Pseudokineococcus sp. TaxID=1642928 RepID=UPI002629F807|nr:DUF1028 domain-containing protein [uncultured Pseudokineococcus sp.]